MPSNLTTAQIRRLVTETAKRLADDLGRQLSDAALRGLLEGSEAYFAEGGSRNVNVDDFGKDTCPDSPCCCEIGPARRGRRTQNALRGQRKESRQGLPKSLAREKARPQERCT